MKLRRFLLIASVLTLFPTVGSEAQVRQMDARDGPEVTGPLNRQSTDCKTQREGFEGDIVAVSKTCLRIYTLAPGSETDRARDYGIVWLQSNLNSSHSWCAVKVLSDVNLPADVTVERKVPRRFLPIDRRKRFTAKLRATGGGTATTGATIFQDAYLYPKEIRTSARLIETQRVFGLKWLGSSDEKLGFPSGAEISWEQGNAPRGISFRLNYELKQKTNC